MSQTEQQYIIEKIEDHRKTSQIIGGYYKIDVFIRWEGYSDSDRTWEPLANMIFDVPELVNQYFYQKSLRYLRHPQREDYF